MPEMEAEGGVVRVAVAGAEMIRVIEKFGEWAHGGRPLLTASEWEGYGLSPREAGAYLAAGVYEPHVAAALEAAGVTGEEVSPLLCQFEDQILAEEGDWYAAGRKERLLEEHQHHLLGYCAVEGALSVAQVAALVRGDDIEI